MNYKLLMGLGNPGDEYADTYHNVGALALDAIREKIEASEGPLHFRKHGDLFEYAKTAGAILARSLVYMNESGRAVKEAARAFDVAPEAIAILHDDSDLPIGEYKMLSGQNAAGHHGVESTIAALDSKEFMRVRIGIRSPNERVRKKAGDFVLKPISAADKKTLEGVFERIFAELFGDSALKN